MSWRELIGRVRGEAWIDGARAVVIRDAAFALTMQPTPGTGPESIGPCERCHQPAVERIITSGGEHGNPLIWDLAPIAVDGWLCLGCAKLSYPRWISPETVERYQSKGVAALLATKWREAEWWFTRITWGLPGYAPAHLYLAKTLLGRLNAGFDTEPEARRRVLRRERRALDDAIEAGEQHRDNNPIAALADAYIGAAEAAFDDRVPERARRMLESFHKLEGVDGRAVAQAAAIGQMLDDEKWVFLDAAAVLKPYLPSREGSPAPIVTGAQRAACTQAVEQLEKHYELHPSHWPSIWVAVDARRALGDLPAVLALWRRALKNHPERIEFVQDGSTTLLSAGLAEEAREVTRNATTRFPKEPVAWHYRAISELLCGDLAEARRCCGESLRLSPDAASARVLADRLASFRPGGPLPRSLDELAPR